ncbi:ankyrin repeat domain-containing protein 26 isoform X4 [Pleurodeles waltl]|uniref:ankyrin repeat domain-containing protein 26 isoform X4 n=1 Tax=Pleurodeles waltl TaxID=8319 RepID=UPI003709C58F
MCAYCQDTVADASGPQQRQSCSCDTPQLCPLTARPCRAPWEPPDAASRLLSVTLLSGGGRVRPSARQIGSRRICPSAEAPSRASPLRRPPPGSRRLRALLGLAAAPMKKILNFAKRKRGASPSASETGSLTSAAGYELRDRDLSKLHRAACAGDLSKLRQLCKKHDPNQQDKERRTPLHLACVNGHPELVTYLVENQSKINLCDSDARSPLMKAVQCQQERCATILLEHDADTNLMDINGNTALHLSALIPSVSLAAQLLEHGAHIDAQNKEGCTPLLLAIAENHQDMVDFLLKQGADINAKDKSKRTPLMIAATNGHISLVKLLVQNDADTFLKDDKGWTCDDYAVKNGHHACSHLIIEHGSKQKQISSPPYHGASKIKGVSMFSSPDRVLESGFQLGGPALDKDELQQSPTQTSRTRNSGKVTDDISQAESESRHSNKAASIDSWTSSDGEEELEFSLKKSHKPSLAVLMNASLQTKKAVHETTSLIKTQPLALPGKSVRKEDLYHDSNEEELSNTSLPKPLPCDQSFPHPAFRSPASFSQPPQKASDPFPGIEQEPEEEKSDSVSEGPATHALPSRKPEPPAHDVSSNLGNSASRKVLMSELGLEEDDAESAWDSESASESPRKQTTSPLPLQAANTQMQSISEEQSGDFSVKIAVQKPNTTLESSQTKDDFKPAVIECMKKQKPDLMEELGLDDADDIEDASDWDSTSTSPKHNKCFQVSKHDESSHPDLSPFPSCKKENKPMETAYTESPTRPSTAADIPDALTGSSQSANQQRPENKECSLEKHSALLKHNKPLPPSHRPDQATLDLSSLEDTKITVNNGDSENSQQEKNTRALRLLKFTEKTSSENEAQNDVSHIMLEAHLEARELSPESEKDRSSSDLGSPWEERYEKLWVDQEKKEVKSHFKTVAAELKQKFGEIIDSPNAMPSLKSPIQISVKESKMTSDVSCAEDDCEAADLTSAEFHPIAYQSIPTSQDNLLRESYKSKLKDTDLSNFKSSSYVNLPTVEHLLNPLKCTDISQKQVNSNSPVQKVNRNPMLQESLMTITVRDSYSGKSMENSQIHSLQEDDLHQKPTNAEVKGYVSSKLQTQLWVAPKNINEMPTSEDIGKQKSQVLTNSNKDKLKYRPRFENLGTSQSSPDKVTSKLLDEGLEQDVQRFKNEVGMLQAVFLNLEKEKAQLQKEVEEEKLKGLNSRKSEEKEKKQVVRESDNSVVQNITPSDKTKQLKQAHPAKTNCLSENVVVTSQSTNSVQTKEKSKPAHNLFKSTSSGGEDTKQEKKNKTKKSSKQTSAKSLNQQQIPSLNGNALQVFDDSSASETSQNEQRSLSNPRNKKDKVPRQTDLAEDFEDLTLSSDTATEDCDSPTSAYRNAMLFIDQLSVEGHDSVNLLKIQNIIQEYERLMEKENGRYGLLLGKVKKLESEKKELQKVIEETRDLKSLLEHQKVEWESDLNSVRFTLKQEEEKRKSVEMLYDKSRDQLRKKEDQCCKEMEGRQQLELSLRNLELELRTLRNSLKQVEEERSEAQRLLSQERSARVVQEGILNNHLWRQKEEEEKKIKMITKMEETLTQTPEVSDREKELMQRNHSLQEEISVLRLELEQVRARNQEEEGKTLEENEALKEKLEDLRRDLKLNEEALTQTVFQYNGQFNALKAESAMLSSKIEHEKQSKERLETELESVRSRLATALQELERSQLSKTDAERTFQRERDDWLRSQDKMNYDLANVREANSNLSQQLTKAEAKTNSLENELHRATLCLREKTLVLESCQRDLNQAQCRAKEFEHALQIEKEQVSKCTVKQETIQERLAQIHSENMLLRQQLEDVQNKGILKEKAVNETQDRFSDIFSKLRDDTEKKVNMVEERNKELITKTNDLREQIYKIETEKVEREAELRKVQQELVDALKKLSMSEASLEVTTQNRNSLEEEKLRLLNEIEKLKCKMQETEEIHLQSERCIHDLKNMLDNKEREVIAVSQKLHEISSVTSGTEKTVKQLEEHVQMLEIENARLEATMKQQIGKIEILQKEQQESVSIRTRLEDLITNLQSTKIGLEEQLNQQVHHQTVLSQTAKDSHNLWEEELKSRSRLGVRLAQLDREKADLTEQVESERKKVKKVLDMKRAIETRLEQEMKRNTELLKEGNAMKKLLKSAKKKLKEFENGTVGSQLNTVPGELKNNHYEAENQVSRLKAKIDELSQNLEMESTKSAQLESTNRDLREQLSSVKTLHKNHDRLEKSKRQLEEEVANLRRHVETNMTDHNQMGQYKREIEERARQEIRQKLEEVNMFLQTQAASQETLEQIRATNDASLRNQMEHRIRDLESELSRIKSTQHDSMCQKESTQSELDRYKDLYSEEIKVRKSLASKLDRANERLAEANARLINERQRSKSLLASSFVNGSLPANTFMDTNQFGANLALNRSIGLPGNFCVPGGNGLSSNRVEAYLAKMQLELEKNITKELDQANAELESRSIRMSPVGSTTDSLRNTTVDQDPISRATQQYLEVLKKNSKI